ncbi:PepSY domain-containing protein [Paucibacter sp. JuS9]|uniref:PepSY domain-containing protein n=1 Tax=Roseateles TaxID=93681 RepID=UPI002FE5D0D7
MNYLPSLRHGFFALSLGLAVLPSWAGDDCEAPVNRWQSREALGRWASAQGWQVKRLKIDDGCYEILGTDAQGRSFKAKVDPETLKVLRLKKNGHQRSRERDHDDAAAAKQPRPPLPEGAPVPASKPASGSAPRGQLV